MSEHELNNFQNQPLLTIGTDPPQPKRQRPSENMSYPKPYMFSDPYYDWEGCADRLREILNKPDADLTTDDYDIIFAKHLPAADYPEGAYYMDKCISHIACGRDVHTSRFPEGFLWWLVHFKNQLKQDNAFDTAKNSLVSAFWTILEQFELFDLTETECESIGRSFSYSQGAYNSSTVCDIIDELTIYDEFIPELDSIVAALAASDRIEHVRWYVEIAFHTRSWCTTFTTDDHGLDNYQRKEEIFHKLHSFAVLQKKQQTAAMVAYQEGRSKYNCLVIL